MDAFIKNVYSVKQQDRMRAPGVVGRSPPDALGSKENEGGRGSLINLKLP
jgi:hypothetical protein